MIKSDNISPEQIKKLQCYKKRESDNFVIYRKLTSNLVFTSTLSVLTSSANVVFILFTFRNVKLI